MKQTAAGRILRFGMILLGCFAALAAPAYFIYANAQNTIVRELGRSAVNIAETISEFTETSIETYMEIPLSCYALYTVEDSYGPDEIRAELGQAGPSPGAAASNAGRVTNGDVIAFYEKLKGVFSALMATTGAQNIYIEKRVSETQKAFLFKDGFQQSARYTAVLQSDDEIHVFENGVSGSSGLLSDKTVGTYISGFVPIKDPQGNVAGIVAVEFSLAYAKDVLNGIGFIVFFSFGAISLLAAIVVYLLFGSRQKYFKKDYLTELCNKSYFDRSIRLAVRGAKAKFRLLSLILIDIDHFKKLNDSFGHQAGDTILKSVSETILKHTREGDICARYGGDEFVILLTDTDKTMAAIVAERIRNEASLLHFSAGDTEMSVTLSIGIAELERTMTAEDLVRFADEAMYVSKSTGKNTVTTQ